MPLRVSCPSGHVLMVPDERAGRAVRCPKCQQITEVPLAAARPKADEGGPRIPAATAAVSSVPSPIQPPPPPAIPPPRPKPELISAPPVPVLPPPKPAVTTAPPQQVNQAPISPLDKNASPPPSPPSPPPAPPKPSVPGLIATPEQVIGAYTLAGIIGGVALFSVTPAIWEIGDYLSVGDGTGIARWAFLLLMLAGVQIGYAVYVAQLPDWTTAWMASLFSLLLAGAYGMLLGITVMSKNESRLIQSLELTDKLTDNRAAFWAIAMISAMSLLAWYAGHLAGGWHRKEIILRQAGLPAGR